MTSLPAPAAMPLPTHLPPSLLAGGPSHAAAPARPRVLILTKVFPNVIEPLAAAFSRQQFAALSRLADVEVLAPVQWFPGAAALGARIGAGKRHAVPDYEWTDGLFVRHPRVLHLPRIDYAAAAGLYVASLLPLVRRLRDRVGVDVILGSFAYPDGVAATWLGRLLGIPSVIQALGSDINVVPGIMGVKPQLAHALARANRVVTVSQDLAAKVAGLGAPPERVVVVPNGVDRSMFFPRARALARRQLAAGAGRDDDQRPWILYVGRLERAKGIGDLLQAFRAVAASRPDVKLVLVGEGPQRERCEQEAASLPGRIVVAGPCPLEQVATWMAAANLLTLPSHNEGTPNVVLEALAAGRKVVATEVGGIPALITGPELGVLVPRKDPGALAAALLAVLADPGDPELIAASGTISWDESGRRLCDVLRAAIAHPVP